MFTNPIARRELIRVSAALAAAAAIGGSLTACSGAGAASDANTLTVWHYYTLDNQLAMLEDFSATFSESHPDVIVDTVYVPADQLNAKIVAAAGSQSGPDVLIMGGESGTTLAAANALAPLTEEWDGFADASQFPDTATTIYDDEIFAVQGYVNLLGLYYNADLLKELGVEPPATVDELESTMDKAVAAGHEGITLAGQPNLQGAFQAYPWLTSAGFSYDDPNEEALADAFATGRNWVEKGYLSPESATWDQNVPFSTFLAGGVAFAENGNWQLSNAAETATFDYGVVPIPVSSDGGTYLGGEAQAIGNFSAKKDLAWDYLAETFLSKQGQLEALTAVGSIPTRIDAAADPAIAADPYLSEFAAAVAEQGARFPDAAMPPENVDSILDLNGKAWSAALSGQQSPEAAASEFVSKLEPLLAK
jgi:multiple sugar transport system substrate-binding protein